MYKTKREQAEDLFFELVRDKYGEMSKSREEELRLAFSAGWHARERDRSGRVNPVVSQYDLG